MKNIRKVEIEVNRSNVTLAQFLYAARKAAEKHGISVDEVPERKQMLDPTTHYSTFGVNVDHKERNDEAFKGGCEREIIRNGFCDLQTYVKNTDGSVYNVVCEWTQTTETKGVGYFYYLNIMVEGEEEEQTEAQQEEPKTVERFQILCSMTYGCTSHILEVEAVSGHAEAAQQYAEEYAKRFGYSSPAVVPEKEMSLSVEEYFKRGMHIERITVEAPQKPENEILSVSEEQEEEEPEVTLSDIVATAKTELSQPLWHRRSAWDRGVMKYAEELVESLAEMEGYVYADDLLSVGIVKKTLLNGASDWGQYSEGGCSLICDYSICHRLCTPSEIKRTHEGAKQPNASETWIDVQSRALHQAAVIACRVIHEAAQKNFGVIPKF